MEVLQDALRGPTCLYAVLGERFATSPLYLRRNLRKPVINRKSEVPKSIDFRLQGDITIKDENVDFNVLSAFVVTRTSGVYLIQQRDVFEIRSGDFSFEWTFALNRDTIRQSDTMFLMLIASKSKLLNGLSHETFVKDLVKHCNQRHDDLRLDKSSGESETIAIKMTRKSVMLDANDHLMRAKQLLGVKKSNCGTEKSPFRYFMTPLTNEVVPFILQLRNACHIFNFDPPDMEALRNAVPGTVRFRVELGSHSSSDRHKNTSTSSIVKSSLRIRQQQTKADVSISSSEALKELVFHFSAVVPVGSSSPSKALSGDGNSHAPAQKQQCLVWHEALKYITCPWCQRNFRGTPPPVVVTRQDHMLTENSFAGLHDLIIHLNSHHFHFEYEYAIDNTGNLHVLVCRDRSRDEAIPLVRKETSSTSSGTRCIPYDSQFTRHMRPAPIFISRLFSVPENGKDSGGSSSSSKTSGTKAAQKATKRKSDASEAVDNTVDPRALAHWVDGRPHRTKYYHSGPGQALTVEETAYDSDAEMVPESNAFALQMRNTGLDEFIDLTQQEKILMKLWNTHLSACPPYGDRLLPLVCRRFVDQFADVIVRQKLRHNLLLHFVTIWDFGLLLAEEVVEYMQVIDAHALSVERRLTINDDVR